METRFICFRIKMAGDKEALVLDFVELFVPVLLIQNYRESKLKVFVSFRTSL